MEARFQDLKSAALACEQLHAAGYPLEKLSLIEDEQEKAAEVEHVSLLDRLRSLFHHDSQATLPNAGREQPEVQPRPTREVALLMQDPTLTPEAREIIRQHGGWLYENRDRP